MTLQSLRPALGRPIALALVVALVNPLALRGSALAQDAPQPAPPVFSTQTAAVVVDVVVRDKKGRLARDLSAQDFEVTEDGVKQSLVSFRVVDNQPVEPEPVAPPQAAAPNAPAPVATPAPAVAGAPSVVAFVFDRLSTDGRKMALKAALTYTDKGHVPGDLVAVFSIDLALRTVLPFSNDVTSVRNALQRAATQGNTAFGSDREEVRRRTESVMRADDTLAGLSGGGSADTATSTLAGLTAVQQMTDQIQSNMLRSFDILERDQQGHASTNALMAVVNGLKAIPGRKTVVFFSEGLAIPANVQDQFSSVIATANRANVSIYAVDAGGLRTESGEAEARKEIVQTALRRSRQEAAGGDMAPNGSMAQQMERTEDMLRLNPERSLGRLATETGGFLIHDTNDATKEFGRIQEEMRFHYVLSYSPTNDTYDGRFRNLMVKIKKPGYDVQSRKGYYAMRPDALATTVPVRSYEAPALALLDRSPRPDAFPMLAAALSFPESERPGLVPVLVEIPSSAVAWAPQRPSGFHADFAVVVRLKNARGQEADRLSQQYALSAPADKLEAARAGKVLFYHEANVPPGHYTAEIVAADAIAQTASVRLAEFDVASAAQDGLRLSSLMLVSRAEKLTPAEQKDTKNPLHFGEVILYPNMGAPFRKATQQPLGFYFTAYGKQVGNAHNATLEVVQGQRVLARTTSELAAPDAAGRIKHAGALPLTSLAPGSYSLRVSVNDGTTTQVREAPFTVTE
jgi:VWFA-related protein